MSVMNFIGLMFFVAFCFVDVLANRLQTREPHQVKKGHLVLPTSQQIGPLYSFGQNIVDKGDLQAFFYAQSLIGKSQSFTQVIPNLLYGMRDDFSLLLEMPIAAKFKFGNCSSSGLQDVSLQLEYAFHYKEYLTATNQVTAVGAITFPTGKLGVVPPVGNGSLGFFLGVTASHIGVDWYLFTSEGIALSTERALSPFSNSVLYQCGVARSVGNYPGWIFAPMVELFGVYVQRSNSKILGADSGGNLFFIGPSFFASSTRVYVQGGVAFVVAEHLFNKELASEFFPSLDVGWKF